MGQEKRGIVDMTKSGSRAAAVVLMTLIASMAPPAFGHWAGPKDPALSKWFGAQHNKNGGFCCDQADGHFYGGGYKFNSDGSVTLGDGRQVEAYKVLDGPNPTGHPVLWSNSKGTYIYCFAPGALF